MSELPKRKQSKTKNVDFSQEQELSGEESFPPKLPPLRTLLEGTSAIARKPQNVIRSEGEKRRTTYFEEASGSSPRRLKSSQALQSVERFRDQDKVLQIEAAAERPYTEVSQLVSESSNIAKLPMIPRLGAFTLSSDRSVSTSTNWRPAELATTYEEERTIINEAAKKRSYPFPVFHNQQFESKILGEQQTVASPLDRSEEHEREMSHSQYSGARLPFFRATDASASSLSKTDLQLVIDQTSRAQHRYGNVEEEEEEQEEEEQSGPRSTNASSSSQVLELLQSKGKKNLTEEERKTMKILRNRLSAEKSRQRQRQKLAELTKQINDYEEVLNAVRSEANALLRYVERLEAFCRLTGIPDYELQRPNLKYLPS